MGCDSEILTHNNRSGECSVTFQLHRVGGVDLTGSSAAWRVSPHSGCAGNAVCTQIAAGFSAASGNQWAPRAMALGAVPQNQQELPSLPDTTLLPSASRE